MAVTGAPRAIIAVDGVDGSGKSVLAARLATALDGAGLGAVLFRIDDFRRAVDWRAAAGRDVDVYYDHYYDLARVDDCLRAFATGASRLMVPTFDSAAERPGEPRALPLDGAGVAIVEGVFPLRVPAAAAADLSIYLQAESVEARRRIIERDLKKGRSRTEIEHRIDTRYRPAQQRYHAACDPEARADVVIDNTQPGSPRVLRRNLERIPEPLRAACESFFPVL